MKNIIIIVIAAVLCLGSGAAFAQGYGRGMGTGPGMMQNGMGTGPGQGAGLPPNFKPVTKQQANSIAHKYMAENMKGYKIISSGEFQGKRFTGYTYTLQNEAGMRYSIIVNARGIVRGPFPAAQ